MNVKPIKTEEQNEVALARVSELWDAKPGTPESDELEVLAILISCFEEKAYPMTSTDSEELRLHLWGLLYPKEGEPEPREVQVVIDGLSAKAMITAMNYRLDQSLTLTMVISDKRDKQ